MATTTIAVYFAGGGLGLMLTGAVLPGMLEAQGPASWPQAWREMGVAAAVPAAARTARTSHPVGQPAGPSRSRTAGTSSPDATMPTPPPAK